MTNLKFVGFLSFVFLYSCSTQQQLSKTNIFTIYNNRFLDPEYTIYHISNDSSIFHFELNTDQLLYKKSSEGVLEGLVNVRYELYNNYRDKKIIDSTNITYLYEEGSKNTVVWEEITFKAAHGSNYVIKVSFTDLNRNQSSTIVAAVGKKDVQQAQFFNASHGDGGISKTKVFRVGEQIRVGHFNPVSDSMYVRCYFRNFPLALPPFSSQQMFKFEYAADSIFRISSTTSQLILPRKGLYHLQFDTVQKNGLTLFAFDEDFPKLTKADQLLESLRYLTTREEYQSILAKPDMRKAIDDYWLEKAGNNERGRKLIKTYYNRVQQANKLFTSFLEGWKTDRGMLYIIFGPPDLVYRNDYSETWRYNPIDGLPGKEFYFRHVNNPFSDNDYQLERSLQYQNTWFMAVDRWRSGLIVGAE